MSGPPFDQSCLGFPVTPSLPGRPESTVPATTARFRPTANVPYGSADSDNTGVGGASCQRGRRCPSDDNPRSERPFCSSGSLCSTLGTPFFPLVESGLDG